MIEISLIKDEAHYEKKQLDAMEEIFVQNFIAPESAGPQTGLKPTTPEIRIHIRLTQGVLPELLFRALGEDLHDFVTNKDFLNAFIHPRSQETPSLVFSFVGDFRLFDFKITSKDEKNLAEGSQKMIEKLLGELDREELSPQSKDLYSFYYEKGDWIEAQ
jgi:hypothetical protein